MKKTQRISWWDLIVLLIVLALLAGILIPSLFKSRLTGRKQESCSRLKKIALAMNEYHDVYGSFPPAWTVDANGRPLHSWRVLLLPFLERFDLYEKIHRDEPWDSESNRPFHSDVAVRDLFFCPNTHHPFPSEKGEREELTCYSVLIGDETLFPGSESISRDQVSDGLSETVLLVERRNPPCWMDPSHEIQLDEEINPEGFLTALADGSVRFIDPAIDPLVWKRLVIRNDQKKPPLIEGRSNNPIRNR